MKLNIYSVFDKLAGQSVMVLTGQNNEVFKRLIRSALLSKQPNPINTDTKDKDIYCIGVLETETNAVTTEGCPKFALSIEQVRLELIDALAAETGKDISDPSEVVSDE